LAGLPSISSIEAAEVDAAPCLIDNIADQSLDGVVSGGGIIAPDEMDRHCSGRPKIVI
jgi:methylmalonyl-CoA mutase cobalamin-binding subunit